MEANERWIWFDSWGSPRDHSIEAYRAYSGCWLLVRGEMMLGPYQDEAILRAYRMAGTLCIDGCEKGPGKSGWFDLGVARPLRRGGRTASQPDSLRLFGPGADRRLLHCLR